MKAHIVGGGFGGLAAAALLIRNAGVSGADITIYEADDLLGGGFFLGGSAASGYNLPGSVFDKEFRCTFDLLKDVPSARNPSVSVTDDFFDFNTSEPYQDRAHIFDRNGRIVHGPRFGLSLGDGLRLARVVLSPEALLDGRRIDEFFSTEFFATEFWFLWSTIMGSLPQHSVIEFRRYMCRFLYLFPDLSDMRGVMRTPLNQHQFFIDPLLAWLRPRGVNFITDAFVRDIGFAPAPDGLTVDRLDYERGGTTTSVAVAPEDVVLVTTGSQAADLCAGSMTSVPSRRPSGRSWALWQRLAQGRKGFGKPDVFFGPDRIDDSLWVTFTVTDAGTEFIDQIAALTNSTAGLGGLVTLKDSGWVLSLSIFHQPEIIEQPKGTTVWWGYGLYPDRIGDFVKKRMDQCTGAEILEETLKQLRFDEQFDSIMASSICVPCYLPYVNNIWLPRRRADRPPPIPEGATNLGLIGQYVEVPREIAFTIECSVRSAWEAIHGLLHRGPPPPPVYQGQLDPKALLGALKVFLR
ncbi:MAG TPA: oleate hydratase [Xanthobacteraceae bacterium]|nr:oleate hydratase [Xanthobacteraceae bacterium]